MPSLPTILLVAATTATNMQPDVPRNERTYLHNVAGEARQLASLIRAINRDRHNPEMESVNAVATAQLLEWDTPPTLYLAALWTGGLITADELMRRCQEASPPLHPSQIPFFDVVRYRD